MFHGEIFIKKSDDHPFVLSPQIYKTMIFVDSERFTVYWYAELFTSEPTRQSGKFNLIDLRKFSIPYWLSTVQNEFLTQKCWLKIDFKYRMYFSC